ncbi:MAG: (d)CMP kinase [Verrucomicrobiales bacterium]
MTTSEHIAVAIDGPAASGKSSVARRLAARLGFTYVNSGAIYRAVTWFLLKSGVAVEDADAVRRALATLELSCEAADGVSRICINGEDPEAFLSSEEVNLNVSKVAAIAEVREILVGKLVAYRDIGHLVMEGRDIGSVVFPDTPAKFYIDASAEVRNARRRKQGLCDEIGERDRHDRTRSASPLVIPEDAVVIDSSEMGIDEVVDEIHERLREKGILATAASSDSSSSA